MAKQLAFYIDSSSCMNCKVCQIACKEKNDNPLGVNFRRVFTYSGGGWMQNPLHKDLQNQNIFSYSISIACMHCQSPICVEVCPTGAMNKHDNGVVAVDSNKCIGCRLCQQACPYGAPQFNEEKGFMTKCDMCEDLLAVNEKPACVDACPMRALDIGELEDLQAKYGVINAIAPLPESHLTNPSVVITPHRHAQASGKGTGNIKAEV